MVKSLMVLKYTTCVETVPVATLNTSKHSMVMSTPCRGIKNAIRNATKKPKLSGSPLNVQEPNWETVSA